MKIVHVSISGPYIDNWGYQVNLLTKYLQKLGVENYVVASSNDFPAYLKQETIDEIKSKGSKYELDGVFVRRIPTHRLSTSFIVTNGLRPVLEEIKPDVIFHHNFNCTSMPICARYARKYGIPLMVDNHADYINMTHNQIWQWFYYRLLIGLTCKIHQKDIYKAYGVTHSRCDFIYKYYGVNRDKIDFLPIGADVDFADTILPKSELRKKYNIDEDSFVVVTGGKMGTYKGTDHLIQAVEELSGFNPKIKLLLFGSFEDKISEDMARKSGVANVFGWCNRLKTLELLKIADVACWPIHHTTLIEDAVSVKTPIINRKTGTSEHLIDGNGIWLKCGSSEEIKAALEQIILMDEKQRSDLRLACKKMRESISYQTVAKKMLEDIENYK